MPNINTSGPPITNVNKLKLFGVDENKEVGWIFSNSLAPVADYAADIEITQYNQLVRDENGEFWRVSGQVDLPYVTTGAGIPEDDALVPVGDAVLRQELAELGGAGLVAGGVVMHVDTIADLLAIDTSQIQDGQQVSVAEYHAATGCGGGMFCWQSLGSKLGHNGGTIISPTVPWDGSYENLPEFLSGTGETNPQELGVFSLVNYVNVNVASFGIFGDWDGVSGTDQTSALQTVISSFGAARTSLHFNEQRYRVDSAKIDWHRVQIVGSNVPDNGVTGGTEFYVGTAGGFYSSKESNATPHHRDFRVYSPSWREANGQVLLDLTGQNYPRLDNITLYGGEKGLKLAAGNLVECHYGLFTNINFSRNYCGLSVETGIRAQTHTFNGGRFWDCVDAYVNRGEGAANINFEGTAFESDQAIRHEPTATEALTLWLGGRNESEALPDIPVGAFVQVGTYWSGNRRAESVKVSGAGSASELTELENRTPCIGVNGALEPVAPNVLPNPLFDFDPTQARDSANIVPGWTPSGATNYASGKAVEGNYIRLERQATLGTQGLLSRKMPLKKGRYIFTCGWKKEGYGATGTIKIEFLQNGVSFGAAGIYADLTFPFKYGASESLGTPVTILQDIDDFQFCIFVDSSTNGKYFYIFNPVLASGSRSVFTHPARREPVNITYGVLAPSVAGVEFGDRHYILTPAPGGFDGYVWVDDGTGGAWKGFGAIEA